MSAPLFPLVLLAAGTIPLLAYVLPQWSARLLAAFVLASTPAVVLEASSTQTDLITAGWAACLAKLVLDGVGRARKGAPGVA